MEDLPAGFSTTANRFPGSCTCDNSDERKDSAGMTSDTSQSLPSSHQNMYTLGVSQIDQELGAQMIPGFFLALKSDQDLLKSIIEQLKAKDELG